MGGENLVTAPSLSDYQLQYGSLVLGAGTGYKIRGISGLGQPDRRSSDTRRPLADGDFLGASFYESREITVTLDLVATSAAGVTALLSALSLAWRGSGILYGKFPGWSAVRAFYGEPRKLVSSDRTDHRSGYLPVMLLFYSPSPAMYGDIATAGTPVTITGGFTFPATAPWSFGTASGGFSVPVPNGGDYAYAPVMRAYGPFSSATITRGGDGSYLGLSVSVASGDYIEIDNDARTIVLSNGTNYRRYMTQGSSWLSVSPGGETFALTATAAEAAITHLQVDSRSAWLA